MKKKMVIFTYREEIARSYYEDLYQIFNEYFDIYTYSLYGPNKNNSSDYILNNADIAIVTIAEIVNDVYRLIGEKTKIILLDFSYSEDALNQINKYTLPGTNALISCKFLSIYKKIVLLFYEYGVTNFIWSFAQDKELNSSEIESDYDVVVIDEFSPNIPNAEHVINLSKRKIAFYTLLKILNEAKIFDKSLEKHISEYCHGYISNTSMIDSVYKDLSFSISNLHIVLNYLDSAVVILNDDHTIFEYNQKFVELFDTEPLLTGKKIDEISKAKILLPLLNKEKTIKNELITSDDFDTPLVVDLEYILKGIDKNSNYMMIIHKIGEIQNKSYSIKRQIAQRGYLTKYTFNDLVGSSTKMRDCINLALKISKIDKTTLILGESGTGKELMAQSVHASSNRNIYPFVSINCAAIPASLLESELFGYEEGAFTGSKRGGKTGLFELANKGTLFLDEVGEMTIDAQSKLLRAIETKEIMRLGSGNIIPIDVRIIAATNQSLKELVDNNKFRLDLYYRLNVFSIQLPPLRERKSDIKGLAEYFINKEMHFKRKIDEELWEFLLNYSWEGNVRELRNVIEYMVNITDNTLSLCHLPDYLNSELTNKDTNNKLVNNNIPLIIHENDLMTKIYNLRKCLPDKFNKYSFEDLQLIQVIFDMINNGTAESRRKLHINLNNSNYNCSDYKLRQILQDLREANYLEFNRGPCGILITELGRTILRFK